MTKGNKIKKMRPPSSESENDSSDNSSSSETEIKQKSKKNTKLDKLKYRQFLQELWPSKYMKQKVKATKRLKKKLVVSESEEDNNEDEDDDSTYVPSDASSSYETVSETSSVSNKGKQFNIVLVETGHHNNNSYSDTMSSDTENEDDPVSTDDDAEAPRAEVSVSDVANVTEYRDKIIENLKSFDTKGSTLLKECVEYCENKLKIQTKKDEKKIAKIKRRNERILTRILWDKNENNDVDTFMKMDVEQQKKVIKQLKEINTFIRIEKPYRLSIIESTIPTVYKAVAMKKARILRSMTPDNNEFCKLKNWVDNFMRIPFGMYRSLPVSLSEDGIETCHTFMEESQQILDKAVYGLNDAKMQVMQMLGQLVTNPSAVGSAIAIKGPMGTGKTSIIKDGVSKILNRPFAFIALGGSNDVSYLEGHSYTYEGSYWGKIVQILMDSKCMNPVIYFDELDKVSQTPKGEEIIGLLTHLTDVTQNSHFHDKYFSDLDFDLSKCIFIFSYNDENLVNPILRDRMYTITTKGYDEKEKIVIARDYLLPKIREQVKFSEEDIVIPNECLEYIIRNYCDAEKGVRNLKRCLEIIYTKLNLFRLMKSGTNLFDKDLNITATFPFNVSIGVVEKLLKRPEKNSVLYSMYC